MTDEQPTPWVHWSDEDLVVCIAHALRHEGKRATRQATSLSPRPQPRILRR
jgi:hypothetical protein